MSPPQRFTLTLAFLAMDELEKPRPNKSVTFYIGDTKKLLSIVRYTRDPSHYDGPAVMECTRPIPRRNNRGSVKFKAEYGPDEDFPRTETMETMDLFVCEGTKATVPCCREGDQYLTNFLNNLMLGMEENGQDGSTISLVDCEIEVKKYFEIYDDDGRRLRCIWEQAARQLQVAKNEAFEEHQQELLTQIDELKETHTELATLVTNSYNRLDAHHDLLQTIVRKLNIEEKPKALDRSSRSARHCEPSLLEQKEIKNYTKDTFEWINPALRGYPKVGTDMHAVYKSKSLIENGLRKLPNFVGTVFRGATMDPKWIQNIKQQCSSGRRVNCRFSDSAFLSTSWKRDTAFYKDEEGKDYNCRFEIKSLTGKQIEKYSVHPFEFEVLFAPDTPFIILEVVEFESGKLFIRMEEADKTVPPHSV
jgi:hypothetical protein